MCDGRIALRETTECHVDYSFLFEVSDSFLFWRLAYDVAGAANKDHIFRELHTVLARCRDSGCSRKLRAATGRDCGYLVGIGTQT